MERALNFWIAGGDLRQVKLAELLAADGHTVHTAYLENGQPAFGEQTPGEALSEVHAARAHCVLLPLPVAGRDGYLNAPLGRERVNMGQIWAGLHSGQIVCGGMLSDDVREAARGVRLFDYYDREECKIANAVPTAEGAVQIAMENMDRTLHGARVLVIGFGRVGKLTAHRFHALGARVTVAARSCADRAWAEAYGYGTEDSEHMSYWLGGYEVAVNTVPVRLLTERHLERMQPNAFLIDLASYPGGVDLEAAQKLGIRAVSAPGIPGKAAPVTAARAIRDSVYNILRETQR